MRSVIATAKHAGTFDVYYPENQTNCVVDFIQRTGKVWEPAFTEWFGDQLVDWVPQDVALIDIGANLGTLSKYADLVRPGMQIIAFEPIKLQFAALGMNLAYAPNAQAVQMALGKERRRVVFGVPSANVGEARQVPFNVLTSEQNVAMATLIDEGKVKPIVDDAQGRPIHFEVVRMTKFDNYTDPIKTARKVFVKIDTEGTEADVIDGMHWFIVKHKPTFMIEAGSPLVANELSALLQVHYPLYQLTQCMHTNPGEEICNVMCVFEVP